LLLAWWALNALAADLAAFDGQWTLDLEASDPIGPLLEAQGVSWIERQAAARMGVTQSLRVAPGRVDLDIRSTLRNESETLLLDDVWRTKDGRDGPVELRHRQESDGDLVTEVRQAGGDRCPCTTQVRRTIAGDRMDQRITWTPKDGSAITVLRVLRREGANATGASAPQRP
jgi:hypothetical protein